MAEYPYDTLFEVERLHPGMWEEMIRRQVAREMAAGDCVIDTAARRATVDGEAVAHPAPSLSR
ncbi:MAG: hypothetical protein HGB17_14385 [Syntrophobacteraceae bacterium]|nr:hypothetical protein [Syntrophobacteraceae bacterium]